METESLAAALEREHHHIDEGIAAFTTSPGDPRPLARAIRALRRHMYLEEEFLFPLLGELEPGLRAPIFVLLREHAQIWAALDALDRQPHSGTALVLCRQLATRLLHHNLKEEKVLYPRTDEMLPPATAARLRAFVDSGEMPAGWVCVRARPGQVRPDAMRTVDSVDSLFLQLCWLKLGRPIVTEREVLPGTIRVRVVRGRVCGRH